MKPSNNTNRSNLLGIIKPPQQSLTDYLRNIASPQGFRPFFRAANPSQGFRPLRKVNTFQELQQDVQEFCSTLDRLSEFFDRLIERQSQEIELGKYMSSTNPSNQPQIVHYPTANAPIGASNVLDSSGSCFRACLLNDDPTKIIIFIGDLHGDKESLDKILNDSVFFYNSNIHLIFKGDYVDRGKKSIETLVSVLLLQNSYPNRVFALMGNHELRLGVDEVSVRFHEQDLQSGRVISSRARENLEKIMANKGHHIQKELEEKFPEQERKITQLQTKMQQKLLRHLLVAVKTNSFIVVHSSMGGRNQDPLNYVYETCWSDSMNRGNGVEQIPLAILASQAADFSLSTVHRAHTMGNMPICRCDFAIFKADIGSEIDKHLMEEISRRPSNGDEAKRIPVLIKKGNELFVYGCNANSNNWEITQIIPYDLEAARNFEACIERTFTYYSSLISKANMKDNPLLTSIITSKAHAPIMLMVEPETHTRPSRGTVCVYTDHSTGAGSNDAGSMFENLRRTVTVFDGQNYLQCSIDELASVCQASQMRMLTQMMKQIFSCNFV